MQSCLPLASSARSFRDNIGARARRPHLTGCEKKDRKNFSRRYMSTVRRRCRKCSTCQKNHLLHVVHMSHTKSDPFSLTSTAHSSLIAPSVRRVCHYHFPKLIPILFACMSVRDPAKPVPQIYELLTIVTHPSTVQWLDHNNL